MKKLYCIFCLFSSLQIAAQEEHSVKNTGSWLSFYGVTRLSKKLVFIGERRYRNYELLPSNEQFLVRGGLLYAPDSANYNFGLGYAFATYHSPEMENLQVYESERRLWEQYELHFIALKCKNELRFRAEQRLLSNLVHFRSRVRLKANYTIKNKLTRDALYLTLEEEFFFNFNKPLYERNRIYFAAGYKLYRNVSCELGAVLETSNNYQRNYAAFAFNYSIDLTKYK